MNKHQVKGMTNRVTGEVKQQVGRLTGDSSLTAKGHAREAKGKLQQGLGDAKEVVRHDERELRERDLERSTRASRR
ncbi:CsbD family protein [Ramlibacter pallidus]|uniref:CsbD family protein n=1 Tax=Ramlibacter pallidus TaxID=2780087 RepID=A0ABR9S2P6_9BURK|nr:CsbD family protein [Ramlibacter pallidus]MBE7367763.1 CsbD family protein [Ramlibacter pallidus]